MRMQVVWVIAAALWACTPSNEGGNDCCFCLVNEGCLMASEYEFCKDALARGTLQLGALRSLTCDVDACVEAGECRRIEPAADAPPPDAGSPAAPPPDRSGREYRLSELSAEFDATKSNGTDWDVGLGGYVRPDPYVIVEVDGERIGTTSTRQDTYYPEWSNSFTVTLSAASRLTFIFMDEDLADDDRAGTYTVDDLQGAIASGGRSESLNGAIRAVSFRLEPR